MDQSKKNKLWFYGIPSLALSVPLGIGAAAVSHGARSLGASLAGKPAPSYTTGEINTAVLIAVIPVIAMLTIHSFQLVFLGREDFSPKGIKKDPTLRPKDKLVAMTPTIPAKYLSREPEGWTLGKTNSGYFNIPDVPVDGDNENFIFIGPPGSGKSTILENYLLYNSQYAAADQHATVFVNDIKPSLQMHTVIYDPSDPSCKVRCINPTSLSDYYFGWDLYHGLTQDSSDDEIEKRADMIARSLIPVPQGSGGDSSNSVFYKIAIDIMIADLLYGFRKGMPFMDSMLQLMTVPLQDLTAEILDSPLCEDHPKLKIYLQAYADDDSEMLTDCDHTMRENLRIFAQSSVQYFFRDSTRKTSPEDLFNGCSIFLQLPDSSLEQYAALIRLIDQDVMTTLMSVPEYKRQGKPMINIILDEFSSLGYMPTIQDLLSRARSRQIRIIVATQSLSFLDRDYTPVGRRSIMQNCETKIILGSSDEESNVAFSKMAGQYRETMTSNGRNGISQIDSMAQHVSYQYRPIYDPSDFAALRKEKKLICFTDGGHYYIDKCPIYLIPFYKEKSAEITAINQEIMKKEGIL